MADISQQQEIMEPPQTNGILDGYTEEEKSKMRPADIDADMREMERRKRVEMMMNSRLFREELERIIETQMKDGSGPSGLLQQISEMMGPQGARFNTNVFRNSNCVVPINDIRGVESMGYAKGEKLLRCKLAAVFRLLDLYGWTQGVGGMMTARLNQDQEHFLVNPYGLLYHEVTASSLIKVDMQGGVVEQGTTNFGVHIASFQLHSTIHAARPDIKCIVHIATPSVTAISSTKCGLLPLGQESIVIGEVSNHHYISSSNLNPEEREKLTRNFGPINKVMFLTNRGALCCGETVEEAFFNVYNTVLACETQLKLMPMGIDNLSLLSDEERKIIYESSRKAPVPQQSSGTEPSPLAEKLEKRWRIGGTEFEALMRMLDNAGFRTGYIYRHPLVKSEPPRPRNDVEVPPAVSSLGYLLEEEELYKQGLWKGGRKGTDRTRWLNSPNVYQKVEILETGTPDPKKITKWVSDGSPTHSSTPVKIDGALQFVPKNTNPKEFKQLQQQIKDYRRADKISAGPQSHILEGVTWEEAKKMQDATISGTGEQVVLVGAASKGIIQRGFQHNATVYKTPYAKNPFDAVTDQELDQYKKDIERKTKGDLYDESHSESEALSSFNISRITHESSTAKSPIQSPISVTSETEEESRDEPKVLRIETKQVPAPSQPEVVLSDGISGVSRLSSSRSNSSSEELESWPGCYEACHLETIRAQEFTRPMKVLITKIQRASVTSRKIKKDFFKNYEHMMKNKDPIVDNNTKMFAINTESKLKSNQSKFDIKLNNESLKNESENNTLNFKRKLQKESKPVVSNIQFSRNANINFAEKVQVLVDYTNLENNMYDVNHKCISEPISSSITIDINITNNNKNDNIEDSLNNTLIEIPDNEFENKINKELNSSIEMKSIEYIQNINYNKNADIYVNEVEFSIDDDSNKVNNRRKETDSKSYNKKMKLENLNGNNDDSSNKSVKNINIYHTNNNDNKEIFNYVNEVELSTYNNSSFDNETTRNKDSEYVVSKALKHISKNNIDNEPEKYKFEMSCTIDPQKTLNTDSNFDKEEINNEVQKNSTLLNIENSKKNPVNANLNIFSKNENKHLLNESCNNFDKTIKYGQESDNVIQNFCKKESDENGNVCLSVNKDSVKLFTDSENLSKIVSSSLDFTYSEIDKFSEDFSPASTTRESFFSDDDLVMKRITRRDSIAEVVSSINADIKPSNKVSMDMLADTENSMKYNLDSQNMSLIYSITPTNDFGDSSKNTTIEDILEDNEDDYIYYENHDDNDEIQLNSNNEKKEITNINKTLELSETSFTSNVSNQGSDLLELPTQTYLDLQKSSDEIFQKNMSTSVNQIINELNDAELFVSAANFVDEIMYDVACLNLPRDISKFSKLELKDFIQEQISALNLTKKLAKDIVGNLHYYDADNSTNSKVSNNNEESNWVESSDQNIYVIQELIHHVIDKDNLGRYDFMNKKTVSNKKTKESINIELKSLKDDYDAADEKNMKCSTPKILSPHRSKDNSFCENQVILDTYDDINPSIIEKIPICHLKCEQISKVPVSSNSSPSTESQNFAEQEVTSESTDNDTKSDNSKEKQINIVEKFLMSQPIFSNVQINSEITSSSSLNIRIPNKNKEPLPLNIASNKISYSIIECATEISECLKSDSDSLSSKYYDNVVIKTDEEKDKLKQLDISENKMSYCVIECINENDSFQNLHYKNKDVDSDSNESIKNFVQNFENCEEEINEMWQINEEKLEEIYAAERRLDDIINISEDTIYCQENKAFIHGTVKIENLEQSSSFISKNKYFDDRIKTNLKFETINELESYYETCESMENPKLSLSTIKIKSKSECADNTDSINSLLESINSSEKLPPIKEVPELNSSCDEYIENTSDTKTIEFYSCQNSKSVKTWDEQENINSTFTASADLNNDYDKTYSADISDISANDVNSDSSLEEICESTLECMTASYDTKEFIQIEMACKSSSEFLETA